MSLVRMVAWRARKPLIHSSASYKWLPWCTLVMISLQEVRPEDLVFPSMQIYLTSLRLTRAT